MFNSVKFPFIKLLKWWIIGYNTSRNSYYKKRDEVRQHFDSCSISAEVRPLWDIRKNPPNIVHSVRWVDLFVVVHFVYYYNHKVDQSYDEYSCCQCNLYLRHTATPTLHRRIAAPPTICYWYYYNIAALFWPQCFKQLWEYFYLRPFHKRSGAGGYQKYKDFANWSSVDGALAQVWSFFARIDVGCCTS